MICNSVVEDASQEKQLMKNMSDKDLYTIMKADC